MSASDVLCLRAKLGQMYARGIQVSGCSVGLRQLAHVEHRERGIPCCGHLSALKPFSKDWNELGCAKERLICHVTPQHPGNTVANISENAL